MNKKCTKCGSRDIDVKVEKYEKGEATKFTCKNCGKILPSIVTGYCGTSGGGWCQNE